MQALRLSYLCECCPGETVPASDSEEEKGTLRLDGELREQEEYMLAGIGHKYGLLPEVCPLLS